MDSLKTCRLPMHGAAAVLEVPGARLRLSTCPLDGPKALVSFGGNAEHVASTLPQLAAECPVSRLVLIAPIESILAIASRVAPFLPMPPPLDCNMLTR